MNSEQSIISVAKRIKCRLLGIPQPIIDKPPSAGLWEGQTDEGGIKIGYDQIDLYLASGEASAVLKKKLEAMISASHRRWLSF